METPTLKEQSDDEVVIDMRKESLAIVDRFSSYDEDGLGMIYPVDEVDDAIRRQRIDNEILVQKEQSGLFGCLKKFTKLVSPLFARRARKKG
jgi:hypothetical protein